MAEGGQPRSVQDGEQEYTFRNVELFKTETLGTGSYGAVCKAKCDELICAAKLLYPILFEMQPQTPEPGKEHRQPFRRFELECRFLSRINHPNIVQYLGTYRDPDTNAPVLLMELMDESLTHFLESSPGPIPYHVQVNLCYDISQALAFLHSNGIIHRDLSSNNVLLIAGSRVKVTDFGMSKFTNIAATRLATMTTCPGTPAFMSPEALNEPPVYTEKLDNFSLGVVMVQVATRKFPKPTDRFQIMQLPDPRFPNRTFRAQLPVPEAERRHAHISLIDPTHPLLPIALHCLKDEDVERPSSQQLCQTLGALKETVMFEESSQQDKDHLLRAKDEQILTLTQEMDSKTQLKDEELQAKDEELQAKDEEVNAMETEMHELTERVEQSIQNALVIQHEAEAKERQLRRLNEQVDANEEITAALQQAITQKERQVSELQTLLSSKDDQIQKISSQLEQVDLKRGQQATVQKTQARQQRINRVFWFPATSAPIDIRGGSSAVVGDMAYFESGCQTVHVYNSSNRQWGTIAKHPNINFTIVYVYGMLTSVGGASRWLGTGYSNKLYSLLSNKWVEHFPPMLTKRRSPAAIYKNNILVVAGGMIEVHRSTNTVEILDTEIRQWSYVDSLPFYTMSDAVGSSVAVVNEDIFYSATCANQAAACRCSLTSLVQSKPDSYTVWKDVTDLSTHESSLATVNGHLLAAGGKDADYKQTKNLRRYNPATNSWEVISQMLAARSECLTAVLPDNKLLVVGGCEHNLKVAEIATFDWCS